MPSQPNIIFLMLDTVRANVLSQYGGPLKLKNIDRIARKSVIFKNAIAPGTYTLPSHLSIFLGKRPRAIKNLVRNNIKNYDKGTDPFLKKSSYVRSNEMTLAKKLSYLGYGTALFSNNPFISSSAGISDGFSYVENTFVEHKLEGGSLPLKMLLKMINSDTTRKGILVAAAQISKVFPDESFDRLYLRLRKKVDRHYSDECGYYNLDSGAKITNKRIKNYLNVQRRTPTFLFANYMEGHEGYPTNLVTDKGIVQDKWLHIIEHNSPEDSQAEKKAYMRRIAYLDGQIGELLKTLKATGFLEDTYLIIAGDHGQAFMEHGQMYHNVFPYNEVVKVPLIIARFKHGSLTNTKKRILRPFSLTELNGIISDISIGKAPMIDENEKAVVSDHLGITEVWDTYLLKMIKSRSVHANKIYRKKRYFNMFASAIFHGDYKLIHFYGRKKDEMYRIEDAQEKENIIGRNYELAHRMLDYNRHIS